MKIIKCSECEREIGEEEEEVFIQGKLTLCSHCIEDYAYCHKCKIFTPIDALDKNYHCEKCRQEESKETRIEGDMEFYKAVFNLDYESIASWSKCGSILFQREIMFRVKRACFWLEKFEEERAKKPALKISNKG